MQQKQLSGIFYAAFASLWWGVVGTIFFKFVSFASFIELTVHRTIWTAVLLILTTSFFKKWPEFIKIFKKRKNQILLFLSGLLVSINWIEQIRFQETRNYVQRVLENINVYKYILRKEPVQIDSYFN